MFKAFDRICEEKGFLNYYLNMINRILMKAVNCKPAEIPEVLVDQFRIKCKPLDRRP